jgi:glycerol-3-phosphate cytidylyltransferase
MRKKVVVYTCGAFDLFHVGHLNILRAAKALGDKLIVGVSTDEVVEDYKPGQLVVPYEQRLQIVSAIKYVDTCVPQTDRDKFKAWQRLKYDILAVGDDWYGTDDFIGYERELAKVGAKVCYLPHTKGVSSSDFRKLLEERYGTPYTG